MRQSNKLYLLNIIVTCRNSSEKCGDNSVETLVTTNLLVSQYKGVSHNIIVVFELFGELILIRI